MVNNYINNKIETPDPKAMERFLKNSDNALHRALTRSMTSSGAVAQRVGRLATREE